MPRIKISLEHGRPTDASCINLLTATVTITVVHTLEQVVPTRTNSLTSALMTFTLESNSVERQDHKFHAPLETAKVLA
jgi:hypothetical protein